MILMVLIGGVLAVWTHFGPYAGSGATFVLLLVMAHVCGACLGSQLQSPQMHGDAVRPVVDPGWRTRSEDG